MRQRLLSYLTAACINLAIVSGTHVASLVDRPPIVRVRPSASRQRAVSIAANCCDARVVEASPSAHVHARINRRRRSVPD